MRMFVNCDVSTLAGVRHKQLYPIFRFRGPIHGSRFVVLERASNNLNQRRRTHADSAATDET